MFARIACSILALASCACVLLATRQVRIQAAHELAEARRRIALLDNELYRLRAEIASEVAPQRIHESAAKLLTLKPTIDPRRPAADAEQAAPASPVLAESTSTPRRP